jgi:hypothetical protein
MKSAVEEGVLREKFTEHDLRRKTGSDTDLEHASQLLDHTRTQVTKKHFTAKPETVRPLR